MQILSKDSGLENGLFRAWGWTFYQEYRRCGKDNCSVCSGGRGHGPYWFRRHGKDGRRVYVGRALPDDLLLARRRWKQLRSGGYVKLRAYRRIATAISRLFAGDPLDAEDRELLMSEGYSEALWSEPVKD